MPDSRQVDRWLIGLLAIFLLANVASSVWQRDSIRRWDPAAICTFTPRLKKVRDAALNSGDRVMTVNGHAIQSAGDWEDQLAKLRPSATVLIHAERQGKPVQVRVGPASPAGTWWEPLVALLSLFPVLMWLYASTLIKTPLARWSRTALLAGPVLVIPLHLLPWDGLAWWLGSLYSLALPLLLCWSLSQARWAHVAAGLLTLGATVLFCAELCFPTYAAVPPAWANTLDTLEQMQPINLYFWILIMCSDWHKPVTE